MDDREEMLAGMLEGSVDACEIWDGRLAASILRERYAEWVATLAPWSVMVTLTFREDRSEDVARRLFMRLVRVLNEDAFGKRYERVVKHSYFSYALATEYQVRGVVHFHFLADRPLNFRLLHDVWNSWAGFALTETIRDTGRAVRYVAKYLVKGEKPELWIAKKHRMPLVVPAWWREAEKAVKVGEGVADQGGAGAGRGSTA